jgi:hypothetical protein
VNILTLLVGFGRASRPHAARTSLFGLIRTQKGALPPRISSPDNCLPVRLMEYCTEKIHEKSRSKAKIRERNLSAFLLQNLKSPG